MNPTTKPAEPATLQIPAEYRATAYDPMTFEATTSRPAKTIHRLNHSVEIADRAYVLVEVLEAAPPLPLEYHVKKGQRVMIGTTLEVASCLTLQPNGKPKETKGFWRIRVLTMTPVK